MMLPEPFVYRFPTESEAESALASVTRMLASDFDPEHPPFLMFDVERIVDGHLVALRVAAPIGTHPIQNLMAAQTLAALLLRDAGICPPGKALGDAISQLEIQGALYALTHLLPPAWSPIVQAALKAAGVDAPGSITGIFTGAIKETFMAVKIEDFEILQALGVGLQDAGKKLQAAKQPGSPGGVVVTTGEKIDIIETSVTDAVKALLGDDVPGLDKYIAMGVALAGMILPLVFKDPATPPAA
jgi:hypothetical protein